MFLTTGDANGACNESAMRVWDTMKTWVRIHLKAALA